MKRFILTVSAMLAMAFSCFAANPESDFIYDLAPDGQGVMITSYKGKSTTVVIPDTIEGLPVTQIGENNPYAMRVFSHTMYDKSKNTPYTITVPKSVKVLGTQAFTGIKGKINIDLSNITKIGKEAFAESDLTGTIKISKNLKFTGPDAFRKTKITAVIIEEGVTELGYKDHLSTLDGMFMDCPNLKSITLPSSLAELRSCVFSNCPALKEVIIPEGTKINYGDSWVISVVFAGCSSLPLATRAKIKATGYNGEF